MKYLLQEEMFLGIQILKFTLKNRRIFWKELVSVLATVIWNCTLEKQNLVICDRAETGKLSGHLSSDR